MVVCNTVLLKNLKKKVGKESANDVLSWYLHSCQGGCTGRNPGKEGWTNLTCSSDDNTVIPRSDYRILKDKKKQMMTVGDSIVGDRCPGQLSC